MKSKIAILPLILILTTVALVFIIFDVQILFVHQVLGFLLALVLPGYALSYAFNPSLPLGFVSRGFFTLGFSIIVEILGGLGLSLLPGGLQPISWAFFVSGVTLISSTIAIVRGFRPTITYNLKFNKTQFIRYSLLTLAGLILISSFIMSRSNVIVQGNSGFTQLWILPSSDKDVSKIAGDEKKVSGKDGYIVLKIGVTSHEPNKLSYRIEFSPDDNIEVKPTFFELKPGETWQSLQYLDTINSNQTVTVKLYRSDAPNIIYRTVTFQPGLTH